MQVHGQLAKPSVHTAVVRHRPSKANLETTARQFLESHSDYVAPSPGLDPKKHEDRLAKTSDDKLKAWVTDIDVSAGAGVRLAWMVGRVLVARRALVPKGKGNVKKWELEMATLLGKSCPTLRLYRSLAASLDDTKIITALSKSDLHLGLNAVMDRIRDIKKNLQPAGATSKRPKRSEKDKILAFLTKSAKANGREALQSWINEWSGYSVEADSVVQSEVADTMLEYSHLGKTVSTESTPEPIFVDAQCTTVVPTARTAIPVLEAPTDAPVQDRYNDDYAGRPDCEDVATDTDIQTS